MYKMNDELARFLARATGKIVSLDQLRADPLRAGAEARWGLAALRGRLVEMSARGASATLTCATELVVEAQTQGEPVAWVMLATGSFYPPDVADSGVDLAALVVIRVPEPVAAARAAERLLRSGAFGLVVIDLDRGTGAEIKMPMQGRLVTLAQAHDAAVVCLTEKSADTASVGSLVSLRAEALRGRDRREFAVTVRALKDKRRGPGWVHTTKRRGPAGLP
jgi:recombination protein RecA